MRNCFTLLQARGSSGRINGWLVAVLFSAIFGGLFYWKYYGRSNASPFEGRMGEDEGGTMQGLPSAGGGRAGGGRASGGRAGGGEDRRFSDLCQSRAQVGVGQENRRGRSSSPMILVGASPPRTSQSRSSGSRGPRDGAESGGTTSDVVIGRVHQQDTSDSPLHQDTSDSRSTVVVGRPVTVEEVSVDAT